MLVISDAMLTSLIWLFDADRFVSVEEIESDVYCSRFWTAPRFDANVEMAVIAKSKLVSAPADARLNWCVPPAALFVMPKLNPLPVAPRPLVPSMLANV